MSVYRDSDIEALLEERNKLRDRVDLLESYLDALGKGFSIPWRNDFEEWKAQKGDN